MKTIDDFELILVKTSERQPKEFATIHHAFIDGRLPIMAQFNPKGWCWLQEIPAKHEPQVIGGKGVTHWIELKEKL